MAKTITELKQLRDSLIAQRNGATTGLGVTKSTRKDAALSDRDGYAHNNHFALEGVSLFAPQESKMDDVSWLSFLNEQIAEVERQIHQEEQKQPAANYTPPPLPSTHEEVSLLEIAVTAAVEAHANIFKDNLKKAQERLGMTNKEVEDCHAKYVKVNKEAVTSSNIISTEQSSERIFQAICIANEHTITLDKNDLENRQKLLAENIAFFIKNSTPEDREKIRKMALTNTSAYSEIVLSELDKNLNDGTIKTKQQLNSEIDNTAFGTTLVSDNILIEEFNKFRIEHDPKLVATNKAKQILGLENDIIKAQKEVSFSPTTKKDMTDHYSQMITQLKTEPGVIEAYNELKREHFASILKQQNEVSTISNTWAMADGQHKGHDRTPHK